MTAKTLTTIRGNVRICLRDVLVTGYDLTDYEINASISTALVELSADIPFKSREAVHTTAGTNQIDTADIESCWGFCGGVPHRPVWLGISLFFDLWEEIDVLPEQVPHYLAIHTCWG